MIRLFLQTKLLVSLLYCCTLQAEGLLEDVHFLIPAGPGGGWDGTARGTGEALLKSGLVSNVSFENYSGGGGGRAIAKLIETASRQQHTLLISSTPIVVRSLQGIFPQSFRDLVPIATVIADYSAIVVRQDSPIKDFSQLASIYLKTPRDLKIAGGSVRGSTDHFICARALELAGGNARTVRYIPYDGGGQAMSGLLTGEADALSTGLSEALAMHQSGAVRIIAISAPERIKDAPDIPTLTEQNVNLVFANWRGYFAAPGLDDSNYAKMKQTIREVLATPEFETVRARNGWSILHVEGDDFYEFLESQEAEIGTLMRNLGYLR